jgi:hypothetical protein
MAWTTSREVLFHPPAKVNPDAARRNGKPETGNGKQETGN